ncbi:MULTISPECIES: ATP-binding protein [Brevibacillus]|uniref:ATP-binding protein n=1 Tax=Brevibacillus TaxID=55080 RepID=UPI00271450A6|nr:MULTISPECIES: HAMP domain-containing sensor histidine kinase [Brevibacillus]
MEAVIFEKDLALDYDIEPGLTVTGCSEQMEQVFMILLDNAIKYANPKGSIHLTLKKHQGHIQLSVTNTGPGIPAEHAGKIYAKSVPNDKTTFYVQLD